MKRRSRHGTRAAEREMRRREKSVRGTRRELRLCAKVWVEIGDGPAVTDAGADLLEQIAACGSLSEAARRLRFSYRRAWMLVDAMNRRWGGKLVTKAVGGERGGRNPIDRAGGNRVAQFQGSAIAIGAFAG